MHIRSCLVLWVTFSSATRWGQRGQLTSPEMSRGARSDLNFFVFLWLACCKTFQKRSTKLETDDNVSPQQHQTIGAGP